MTSNTATASAAPLLVAAAAAPVADEAKRDWHAATTVQVRRRVLLQILLLLKTKYGKVDEKISYIARRAELALYTQAFSVLEYRNPKTLNRRLHSLVVKLHMNNLAAHEDTIFNVEEQAKQSVSEEIAEATSHKRVRAAETISPRCESKRLRSSHFKTFSPPAETESPVFFDGNTDLVRHMCSFLTASDTLQLAATNLTASLLIPAFITSICVAVGTLERLLPPQRTSFFSRFPNLESFEVRGDEQSHLHFDFQNELALVRRNVVCRSMVVALARQSLLKLKRVSWHYAYVDGVRDRITAQLVDVLLDAARFPLLGELSLVGNAVSDDGVSYLCAALRQCNRSSALRLLNLEQNFVGERGQLQLEELSRAPDHWPSKLQIKLSGNLLATSR